MKRLGGLPRAERGEAWSAEQLGPAVSARRAGAIDAATAAALLEWDLRLGASPATAEAWNAVSRGDGVVVVTGQQPALLGGPLYTLYKLLTAEALAREVEARFGRTALAVFWLVGDDSDFGEVAAAWFPDAEGRPLQLRDAELPARGALIGRLASARQGAIWAEVRDLLAQYPGGNGASALVEECLAVARDWSEFNAALFHRLVPDARLLVIDGAHPALLAGARPFLLSAQRDWPLAALLAQGQLEARTRGFEPALESELAERALFRVEEQGRRPLEPGESAEAGVVAPNVVLRPLLQDWLLPNVATVCGAAEIRYRAELGPLYRHAGVAEPLRPSRMHALLLPPGEAIASRWELASSDPEAVLREAVTAATPPESLAELTNLRSDTHEALERLGASLAQFDPSLRQQSESAAGKIDFQLQRLLEGLSAKVRHRIGQREPLLLGLKDWVAPREREQERVHSLLLPLFAEGAEGNAALTAVARAEVRARLDGELEGERSVVLALAAAPERRRS